MKKKKFFNYSYSFIISLILLIKFDPYVKQPAHAFFEDQAKYKILNSQLESLNVLYVSLTRAINNLFLICPKEIDINDPLKSYSTLINQFLICL